MTQRCTLGSCKRPAMLFVDGMPFCSYFHYAKLKAWESFFDELEKGIQEAQARIDAREKVAAK